VALRRGAHQDGQDPERLHGGFDVDRRRDALQDLPDRSCDETLEQRDP